MNKSSWKNVVHQSRTWLSNSRTCSFPSWDFRRYIDKDFFTNFLMSKKMCFFFDFENVIVSLWEEWGSMILIKESEKGWSMRKDTRRRKFLFWTKTFIFFVLTFKTDIIRQSFRNPWKNENPTKSKNESIWDSTMMRAFQWRWKLIWKLFLVFFAYYQNDSKVFWKNFFQSKCDVFTNTSRILNKKWKKILEFLDDYKKDKM